MAFILAMLSVLAKTAGIFAAIITLVIVTQNQSNIPSLIESATRSNTRLFRVYVVALVFIAVLTTLLTWALRRSDNNLAELVRDDANAKIEEAKAEASTANKTARQLESDNLTLKTEVAKLQEAAARQQERAALAERALIELQEKVSPRRLTSQQSQGFVADLRRIGPQRVDVFMHEETVEVANIGNNLIGLMREEARWVVRSWDVDGAGPVLGIEIQTIDGATPAITKAASELVQALVGAGIFATLSGDQFDRNLPFVGSGMKGAISWDWRDPAPIGMHIGGKP